MRNKIVGIDFHSTLVNFVTPFWVEACTRMRLKRGTLKPPDDFKLSCYHKKVQIAIRNLFLDPNFMMDINPARFAQTFINWLKNRNCEVRIITATALNLRGRVRNYIVDVFEIPDESIYFVDIGGDKKPHFKELTYWVDDNPYTCLEAYEAGLYTFLISNDKTPWNSSFEHNYILKKVSLYGVIEHFKGV